MNREIREILYRALEVYQLELQDKIRDVEQIFAKYNADFRKIDWTESHIDIFSAEELAEAESGRMWERELEIVNQLHKDFK